MRNFFPPYQFLSRIQYAFVCASVKASVTLYFWTILSSTWSLNFQRHVSHSRFLRFLFFTIASPITPKYELFNYFTIGEFCISLVRVICFQLLHQNGTARILWFLWWCSSPCTSPLYCIVLFLSSVIVVAGNLFFTVTVIILMLSGYIFVHFLYSRLSVFFNYFGEN